MTETQVEFTLLELTTKIVSAHVANNELAAEALPAAIRTVYETLSHLGDPPTASADPSQPAVPIRKSVFPDYIICLEDGQHMKMLKRHLATTYNMTPDQYREKWGLGDNYPMVAPNYAERRSKLAKASGLGTRRARF